MPFDGRQQPLPLITAAHVRAVAHHPDPVRRNLRITLSYHDLARAVGHRLGHDDASWVLFATWASKTAGTFIRGDWLHAPLRHLAMHVAPGCAPWLDAVDTRVRHHIAEGNQQVYAEIAPMFVTLLELLDTPASERAECTARALEQMPSGSVEDGGQDALARALRTMLDAAALPPGPARAQCMLRAGLLIGAHEQYRLQATIVGALDAAWPSAGPLTVLRRRLQRTLAPLLRRQITQRMMWLGLPETRLEVGRDIPALPDGRMFPPQLATVTDAGLQTLIERFDRAPHTTRGSAARDWTDYGHRMNYITDLFRSRQQSPSLWSAPFDPEQTAAIRRGLVPAGVL